MFKGSRAWRLPTNGEKYCVDRPSTVLMPSLMAFFIESASSSVRWRSTSVKMALKREPNKRRAKALSCYGE